MDARTYISALEQMGKADYEHTAKFRVRVPTGKAGPWTIRRFKVPTVDLAYLRHARDNRAPGLGKFTALNHEEYGMVMSDTVPEVRDLTMYAHKLQGHVLVTGLGLGMAVNMLTKVQQFSDHVKSVTVIEKDADLIKLVGKFYEKSDKRVKIIHADAFEWKPNSQIGKGAFVFDSAWHDIWYSIEAMNALEMTKLRNHYRGAVAKGQQYCWGQDTIAQMRRRKAW